LDKNISSGELRLLNRTATPYPPKCVQSSQLKQLPNHSRY